MKKKLLGLISLLTCLQLSYAQSTNPLFQLSVVGNQIATGQGWTRGILLSNSAALMWDGGPYKQQEDFRFCMKNDN